MGTQKFIVNMLTPSSSKILLLVAFGFLSSAVAQNTTNTTTCVNDLSLRKFTAENAAVNSTGTRSFSWTNDIAREVASEPWYISVLVNDTLRGRRSSAYQGGIETSGFVSVPNDVRNTSMCLYQFSPMNATSTGDGNSSTGCGGVLSDTCTAYLRNIMIRSANPVGPKLACPNVPIGEADREKRREACGEFGGIAWTSVSTDVSNQTCSFASLPDIDLPDNYHSLGTAGTYSPFEGIGGSWDNISTQAYDLHVTQSVPFAVVGAFVDVESSLVQTEIQFVCVTPNNTQAGSRVPEDKTPWENAAAREGWHIASRSALAIAGVVGVLLAL